MVMTEKAYCSYVPKDITCGPVGRSKAPCKHGTFTSATPIGLFTAYISELTGLCIVGKGKMQLNDWSFARASMNNQLA